MGTLPIRFLLIVKKSKQLPNLSTSKLRSNDLDLKIKKLKFKILFCEIRIIQAYFYHCVFRSAI